jgi:hypothetical protein
MKIVFVFALLLGGVALLIWASHAQRARRARFIDEYAYPKGIRERVRKRYPHLTDEQLDRVMRGLTEWFHLHREAGRVTLSMPSKVVDAAWHEFILFTAGYRQFCSRALGRFLNHTPAEAMRSPTTAQDGLRRTWRRACARAGIDPAAPARLPLLFALDAELGIADGFSYALDCRTALAQGVGSTTYCATDITSGGCASGCSGDGGDGDGGGGCGGD